MNKMIFDKVDWCLKIFLYLSNFTISNLRESLIFFAINSLVFKKCSIASIILNCLSV